MNISSSSERLASDLRNPEGELYSKIEIVVRIFEDTDFPTTIAIYVYDNQDQ